jgi:site-specific DNA recombinase
MRVALYARVSTDGQTVEVQRAILLAGLGPDDELVRDEDMDAPVFEDPGWSGALLERPALSRLRELVRARGVDQVRCVDPDRISRDLADKLFLDKELRAAGVVLAGPNGQPFANTDTPMGFAFDALQGVLAQVERMQIAERTARGRLEHARAGRIVNPGEFFWMAYDKQERKYVLRETEAATMRSIVERVLAGHSLQSIVYWLIDSGVATTRGGKWRTATLARMLRNPALKGELVQRRYRAAEPGYRKKVGGKPRKTERLRPQEDWIRLGCPRLITDELWDEVQRRIADNKRFAARNSKHEFLLSGILRCSVCGRAVHGASRDGKKKGVTYTFYRCNGKLRSVYHPGPRCTSTSVASYRLDEPVWAKVRELLEQPELVLAELSRLREKGAAYYEGLERELEEIDTRALPRLARERDVVLDGRRKLPELYTLAVTEAEFRKVQLEEDRWLARRAELVEKLGHRRLSELQIASAASVVGIIRDRAASATFEQRREVVRTLVDHIVTDGRSLRWEFEIRTPGERLRLEQQAAAGPIIWRREA